VADLDVSHAGPELYDQLLLASGRVVQLWRSGEAWVLMVCVAGDEGARRSDQALDGLVGFAVESAAELEAEELEQLASLFGGARAVSRL
jgi:hypothetical protein